MEIESLGRKELQALAKKHGLKANASSSVLLQQLREILQKEEEPVPVQENTENTESTESTENIESVESVENSDGNDSKEAGEAEPIPSERAAEEIAAPPAVISLVEDGPFTSSLVAGPAAAAAVTEEESTPVEDAAAGEEVEVLLEPSWQRARVKRVNKVSYRVVLASGEEATVKMMLTRRPRASTDGEREEPSHDEEESAPSPAEPVEERREEAQVQTEAEAVPMQVEEEEQEQSAHVPSQDIDDINETSDGALVQETEVCEDFSAAAAADEDCENNDCGDEETSAVYEDAVAEQASEDDAMDEEDEASAAYEDVLAEEDCEDSMVDEASASYEDAAMDEDEASAAYEDAIAEEQAIDEDEQEDVFSDYDSVLEQQVLSFLEEEQEEQDEQKNVKNEDDKEVSSPGNDRKSLFPSEDDLILPAAAPITPVARKSKSFLSKEFATLEKKTPKLKRATELPSWNSAIKKERTMSYAPSSAVKAPPSSRKSFTPARSNPTIVPKMNAAQKLRLDAMKKKNEGGTNPVKALCSRVTPLNSARVTPLTSAKVPSSITSKRIETNKGVSVKTAKPSISTVDAAQIKPKTTPSALNTSSVNKSANVCGTRKHGPDFSKIHQKQFNNSRPITAIVERKTSIGAGMDAAFVAASEGKLQVVSKLLSTRPPQPLPAQKKITKNLETMKTSFLSSTSSKENSANVAPSFISSTAAVVHRLPAKEGSIKQLVAQKDQRKEKQQKNAAEKRESTIRTKRSSFSTPHNPFNFVV